MPTALITLTTAGVDADNFSLLSNATGYGPAFESGISRASLLAGYTSNLVPAGTTIIRVKSNSASCSNYIDIAVGGITTTTTTSTTTTAVPNSYLTNYTSSNITVKFTLWVKNTGGTYSPVYSSPTAVFIGSGDTYGFYQTVYPGIYPTTNKGFKLTIDAGSIGIIGAGNFDESVFYLNTSTLGTTTSVKTFNASSPTATEADDSKTGSGISVTSIDAYIAATA